ncbi:MAG: HEAT repeat domain-containing protein [Nitrospirota bacterium]
MEEEKQEKLPIDARLLSEAVIELNISRRSVGLYPSDHSITKESINRAYELLKKLFELRNSITLGIAKDILVIDEYTLDKKNPVFLEFALSLHEKGIASITFYSGLETEELISLHELITMRDGPTGKAFLERAEKKGLRHIRLDIIDLSKFNFMQEVFKPAGLETKLWEDYIYGLFEGKLADAEADAVIINIPPEEVAMFINSHVTEDTTGEAYDRVISTYLRRKGGIRSNKEIFEKFMSLISSLTPELKSEFLKRAFCQPRLDVEEIERTFAELKEEDIHKLFEAFKERSLSIPEGLLNVVAKLTEIRADSRVSSYLTGKGSSVIDDIEFDESILKLLGENYDAFVGEQYKKDLETMLKGIKVADVLMAESLRQECQEKTVDSTFSDTMLELLESDCVNDEAYLNLLTKFSELSNIFLETGRFSELCDIYNTLYSHSLTGRFKVQASGMIDYFYRSEQFISRLIDSFKLWGRYDREGSVKLARLLKQHLINPLLNTLSEEKDSSIRKYLLYLFSTIGSDVVPEAVRRLSDNRWYVVRNMLYILREAGGRKYLKQHLIQIKRLAEDKNEKICVEAVKTLLEIDSRIASSYLKQYLRSKNPELRQQAVMLSSVYKVRDVVPYLIDLLEKKDLFGTESYYKIPVVRALGDIGDSSAIDHLIKLYNSKSLLYKGVLDELKLEIFRNLQNYPQDAIMPLLELGIKSKNGEIKSISESLLSKIIAHRDKGNA